MEEFLVRKQKTGWFHLIVVVLLTLVSFYYIKNAFAKPYAEFNTYNEIRSAEIRAVTGEIEGRVK